MSAAEHFMMAESAMVKLDKVATLFAEAKGIANSDAGSMIDLLVTTIATETPTTYEEAASMLATNSENETLSMLDNYVDRFLSNARAKGLTKMRSMTYSKVVSVILAAMAKKEMPIAEASETTKSKAPSISITAMTLAAMACEMTESEHASLVAKAMTLPAEVTKSELEMLDKGIKSVAEARGVTESEASSMLKMSLKDTLSSGRIKRPASRYGFLWDTPPTEPQTTTAFAEPQSDQLRSAMRRKQKKEQRKAEKEKSWKTEGDIEKYDFDKVLRELGDGVEDVNIGKKAGKKSLRGQNNSARKGSDASEEQRSKKKKKKKSNSKQDLGGEEKDEEKEDKEYEIEKVIDKRIPSNGNVEDGEDFAGAGGATAMSTAKSGPSTLEMEYSASCGSNVEEDTDLDLRMMSLSSDEHASHSVGQITVYPEKVLGQGGYGTVCEGKFGGRQVAVKRIPKFLANVDQEAQLHMACDSHENVLRYIHMEEDKMRGLTYLVVELCQGTLVDYVEGKLVVDRKQPKDLLKDATKGLIHLHKLGIVHRDVKPSNILISRPESGIVKAVIGDFGVSKKLEDGHQSFSVSQTGTQRWMAPEILFGDSRATIVVDVYALGWVFFYVLAGKQPFNGKNNFELMMSIKNGEKNLGQQMKNETANSLIESMTSLDAQHRPPMEAVLENPFFWDNKKKLNFIEVVSDHLKSAPQVNTILKRSKDVIFGSSKADWGKIASEWSEFAPVINHLKSPQENVAKYDFTSVPALLRAIRNLSHHLTEQPREIQAVFGGSAPKTLVSDVFLKIFPQLLVGTWSLAGKEIGHEAGFQEFYHEWWVNNA